MSESEKNVKRLELLVTKFFNVISMCTRPSLHLITVVVCVCLQDIHAYHVCLMITIAPRVHLSTDCTCGSSDLASYHAKGRAGRGSKNDMHMHIPYSLTKASRRKVL
jgi:hypothetical protein